MLAEMPIKVLQNFCTWLGKPRTKPVTVRSDVERSNQTLRARRLCKPRSCLTLKWAEGFALLLSSSVWEYVPVVGAPWWSRWGGWWRQREPPESSTLLSAAAWSTSLCCGTEKQTGSLQSFSLTSSLSGPCAFHPTSSTSVCGTSLSRLNGGGKW